MAADQLNGIDINALAQIADTVSQIPEAGKCHFNVCTQWQGQARSVSTVQDFRMGGQSHARDFRIEADEPEQLLGSNTAANPQELLMAALNACMTVGYAAQASARGVTLHSLEIETSGALDLRGFLGLADQVNPGYNELHYTVRMDSDGTAEQMEAIHQAVMATSPNFANLAKSVRMVPTLELADKT